MKTRRFLLSLPLIVLTSFGIVIGLVLCPIWYGVKISWDLVEDFIDKAPARKKAS